MSNNQPIEGFFGVGGQSGDTPENIKRADKRNFFEKWIDNVAAGFGGGIQNVTTGIPKALATGLTTQEVAKQQATAGITDTGLAAQSAQVASQAISQTEEKSTGWLYTPYREYVARPLSTAFLAANIEYQKQIGGEQGMAYFDVETWKRAWQDARHVSPGQSIVGFVGGSLVDGTQGVDKIDWSNAEEVRSYFNHGPQRWISFGADFATASYLDPYILGGKGIGKLRRSLITVPVTTKNMPTIVNNIDKAATGVEVNSWSPVIEYVKQYKDSLSDLLAHPTIAQGGTEFANVLQTAANRAIETGSDTFIGDAFKVSVGDSFTLDKAMYDATFLADEIGILSKKKVEIEESLKDFASPPMGSKQGLLAVNRRSAVSKMDQRLVEANAELNVADKISTQTLGTLQQRTVSRFGRYEQARANSAKRFSDSYWTQDIGPGARVTHYFEPGSMLREKSSGRAEVSGLAGDRSNLEYAARLREWARINKKPGALAKKYYDMYLSDSNRTSRHQALIRFDEKAMRDTVITRMREHLGRPATPTEAKLIIELADSISKNSRLHKNALLERVVDRDYTIVDETGSTVYQKYLKDYENRAAQEIAQNRAGPGTKPNANDIAQAKKAVKESLSEVIPSTSKLPNIHFGVNLARFDDIVVEHASQFKTLIDELQYNPRLQNMDIKQLYTEFAASKSSELLASGRMAKSGREKAKYIGDLTVEGLDSFYNSVWKPITLASLHYASRNVFEGWQRAVAVALETSRDTGMPVSQILRDSLEPTGGVITKLNAALTRKGYNKFVKDVARTAQNLLNSKRSDIAGEEYKYNKELADSLYNSTDSVHSSLLETVDVAERIVQNYSRPTIVATQLQKDVVENMQSLFYRLGDETNLPAGVNKELFNAIVDVDTTRMFEILSSVDERYILETLAEVQQRVTKQRSFIEQTVANQDFVNLPYGMREGLLIVNARMNNLEVSLATTGLASISKAAARGRLEDLISSKDVLNNIKKSAEGEFEYFPGLKGPDSFADIMGAIMRQEVDAVKSSTSAIFNLNNVTLNDILHGRVKGTTVNPFIVDEKTGIRTTNTAWAEIAADYANRQTRFDESIQQLIKIDVTDAEQLEKVVKWAKGPEAKDWRYTMRISLGKLKEEMVDDPIRHLVERNAIYVQGNLPEIGVDGRVISPLKDAQGNFVLDANGEYIPSLRIKASNGELTSRDMLDIPEADRTTTYGNVAVDTEAGNITSTFANNWKTATQWMFKHIGSNPETYLVRHPFYTMMYRTEMRRLANLMKSQGRSLEYIDGRVGDISLAAHKYAYKNTMEKLYSVERKTDPGNFMRFLSPFYMAKQNSNRFWYGYYMRNPQAFARYFQLYSSPTRIFDVEDESGKDVTYVNPLAPAGAGMMVTLPESVAKYLNIPADSKFKIYIPSFDLINNGTVPFVPEPGGPAYTYGTGWLLNGASGKPYDPELFLANLGIKPSILTNTILPFYKTDKSENSRDSFLNAVFDVNSWMDSALTAVSTKTGISIVPTILTGDAAKDRFNARLVRTYLTLQQDWVGEQDKFVQMSPDEQSKHIAEMLSQAASYTTSEFLLEGFLSAGPTIGNAKIEDKAIRIGKELRQYQKQYGQDDGKLRYLQFLAGQSDWGTAYRDVFAGEFKSREVNMFGVLSTPQTVYNISQNKEVWNAVKSLSTGKDSISDSKILGALFNGGDALKDYTPVANQKLYKMGVKKNVTDPEELTREASIESGNSMLMNYLDFYKAEAETKGIKYRSSDFDAQYKDKIAEAKKKIGNVNPAWKFDQQFSTTKALKHISIINSVVSDPKFIATVGKSNPIIPALVEYMEKRKPFVKTRMAINSKDTVDIYDAGKYSPAVRPKEEMADELIKKYPGFKDFYNYYLSNDPLLPPLGIKE